MARFDAVLEQLVPARPAAAPAPIPAYVPTIAAQPVIKRPSTETKLTRKLDKQIDLYVAEALTMTGTVGRRNLRSAVPNLAPLPALAADELDQIDDEVCAALLVQATRCIADEVLPEPLPRSRAPRSSAPMPVVERTPRAGTTFDAGFDEEIDTVLVSRLARS